MFDYIGKRLEDHEFKLLYLEKDETYQDMPKYRYYYQFKDIEISIELNLYKSFSPFKATVKYKLPKSFNKFSFKAVPYERKLAKKCQTLMKEIKNAMGYDTSVSGPYFKEYNCSFLLASFRKYKEIKQHLKLQNEIARYEENYIAFENWAQSTTDKNKPYTLNEVQELFLFNEDEAFDAIYKGCERKLLKEVIEDNTHYFYIIQD
jgi:hypothetical protein